MAVKTGWYFKIVDLYETNREKYEQLLAEDPGSVQNVNEKIRESVTWVPPPKILVKVLKTSDICGILSLLRNRVY